MGTWILGAGCILAVIVSAGLYYLLDGHERIWALPLALIVGVLIFGLSFSIAAKVDTRYATVECTECGEQIGNGDKFCAGCGIKVAEE